MLRVDNKQISIFEYMLPEELKKLPDELAMVDSFLNDEKFIEPFVEHFHKTLGRPSTPVQVYLRMMYLKRRYNLGYNELEEQVKDRISWRIFCHIPLGEKVPDGSTLCKLTEKFGSDTLDFLNECIIVKAKEEGYIKAKRVRVDTTVMESNIHYPTDSELLRDGIRVITRVAKKISEVSRGLVEKLRDRGRSVKKRVLKVVKLASRRSRGKYEEVRKITGEIADIASDVVKDAKKIIRKAKEVKGHLKEECSKKIDKLTEELKSYVSIVEKVIEQTRKVNEGDMHIAGRIVSIFDEGARPIKRGKVHKAVEFGRKVLLVESEEGVITYYNVYEGNPGDETLLVGGVLRHWDAVGNIPKEVAADRGFYSSDNERVLRELGVKRVSIPKRGKKSKERQQYESRTWFRRLQRFRAGGEASISHMKRCRGLGRSSVRGTSASRSYVALGIMAQNLWRLARIMA